MLHNAPHIVVLSSREFATCADDNFVAAAAEVLFVVYLEVATPLEPHLDLVSESVCRRAHLKKQESVVELRASGEMTLRNWIDNLL